jgi:uncharacterized membrane protein (DUF373 family)
MFDAARRNLLQRRTLEFTQDVMCGLYLLVFVAMGIKLIYLVRSLFNGTEFSSVVGEVLFILVLPELFRLLLLYLDEHRVSVATMVEVGIVSTLREVISRGALHIDWPQLPAVCVFMLTLGVVLRFSGIRLYAKGGKPGEERTTQLGACYFRPTPLPERGIRAKQI